MTEDREREGHVLRESRQQRRMRCNRKWGRMNRGKSRRRRRIKGQETVGEEVSRANRGVLMTSLNTAGMKRAELKCQNECPVKKRATLTPHSASASCEQMFTRAPVGMNASGDFSAIFICNVRKKKKHTQTHTHRRSASDP